MAIDQDPDTKTNGGGGKKNDKGANEKNTTNNNVDTNDKSNGEKKSGRRKNQNQKKSGFKPKRAKVKCQITELKGFAFNCTGYRQAEEFKEAKEALESYLSSQCKYGTDIRITVANLQKFDVPDPNWKTSF